MEYPRLSFWFLFILNFLVSLTTPQPAPRYDLCSISGNYTTDSTYSRNLNDLLSSIPTSSDLDSDGFFNASIGQNPDQVYAIGLCRGDLTITICRSCLNDSVQAITQACPNKKQAGLWYEKCMLRFSDRNILNTMDNGFVYVAWKIYNQTTPYNNVLEDLLPNLRDRAAAGGVRKYAPGEFQYMGNWTIYALEQCTPDISELDCKKCLNLSIADVFTYCTGRIVMPAKVRPCHMVRKLLDIAKMNINVNVPNTPLNVVMIPHATMDPEVSDPLYFIIVLPKLY
ncbi:hypothetical protein RJ640_005492 [Escallonia rubra]|uniref:Gnk2-homologous domain-containing protein n=1 Tax=Escallonia rubra TaxID=112253 RepID=A0AA88RWY3_9ASTE|nr:hypothetical protein RJ640_005492 [Escallonia rubra]